ncbi:MAG: DUF3631 domain-containing protein [Actinomycetales bacterium]|nr:MAG: DUF3631 domain-containing protein [Actinomycetales bacterium]
MILDDIEAQLRKLVILKSDAHYVAGTLWIAHTYPIDCFDFTPRLAIWSPEKRCGKSLFLELVKNLTEKSSFTSSISSSVLYRMISGDQVKVFLIDEADRIFGGKGDREKAEALNSMINSGFKRGAVVWRCKPNSLEPQEFQTFAPVALAGIGAKSIPETIADRAIVIQMRRKYPNEEIFEYESDEADAIFSPLRAGLASWIESIKSELRPCKPEFPIELNSRARDVWRPLFKIASSAGGEWPEKARMASLELSAGMVEESEMSFQLRLLSDCRQVFHSTSMNSRDLVIALKEIEEAPYGHGDHQLNTAQLARHLRQFQIRPRRTSQVRLYWRDDFEEAWSLYLPLEAVISVTPVTDELNPALKLVEELLYGTA